MPLEKSDEINPFLRVSVLLLPLQLGLARDP